MTSPTFVQCEFLIPQRRDSDLSDGKKHRKEAWEWLDEELFVEFGGGTVAPGWYRGAWRDPDTQSRVNDLSRKFFVALAAEEVQRLRDLLTKACTVFEQKMIYLNIGGKVEFLERRSS